MATIPGRKKVDIFDLKLRGSFGRFRTDSSHALHYLSTTMRIGQVAGLKVAAEVFDIASLDFAELIQRDIDYSRVQRIADGYLKLGQNKPIFFPPLLICLAVMDENDQLKSKYSCVDQKPESEGTLSTVFDGDGFHIDLFTAEADEGGRNIMHCEQAYQFFDYAALLGVNTRRTKLIVLDGQHRLRALTHLHGKADTRHIVANIEQPVCVVWMPGATLESDEEIVKDLREIFVRVNTEPQRVSGHFLLLLDDNSNAAAAVRSLANHWKRMEANGGWSRLHLLEWNTRENQSTDQRQRPFSISTVSVIASVLERHLFDSPKIAPAMLHLADIEGQLENLDPDYDPSGMRNDSPPLRVRPLVEEQIDKYLTPALDHLLRDLRPYKDIESRLERAWLHLSQRADKDDAGSLALQAYLSRYVYNEKQMTNEFAPAAWAAFKNDTLMPHADAVFGRHAFQQGYLRTWLALHLEMDAHRVDAIDSAKATVAALDAFVTGPGANYLGEEQPYARRVLWKNGNINFGAAWTRDAWTDIQLSTLVRRDVRDVLIGQLGDSIAVNQRAAFAARIYQVGLEAALRYTAVLKTETVREVRRNLADFFGEAVAGNLRAIRQTNPDDFDREIAKMAGDRFDEALMHFANKLEEQTVNLQPVE
ncbi:hypothetical protein VC279_19915 [Xanthomonas sp. WHRI 10064A]|uniref:hypothetical protein n=1 Tax=unclassified Xanthomonas TaxID=2643310 RepID=UPI002B22BE06|nr:MULTISPECIES: hypothetical protein [unclassified Xanthomonas]MEA9589196.1 hypothetical protein [Xanthomonas sp. WHRI 10064B]MEA9616881.1 hypothetical protein [Xanthomonas sp. WHRI 10064A]